MDAPTPAALSQRWQQFTRTGMDGRIDLFTTTLTDGLMTPAMAAQMAARLHHDTAAAGDRARFDALMQQLETTLPRVYAAAGAAVIQWRLLNAVLAGHAADIRRHADTLAAVATAHLDAFTNALDMLAYHGQTETVVHTLTAAQPHLQQAGAHQRRAIDELLVRATDELIFAHLATGNTAVSSALLTDMQLFFAIDEAGLERYLRVLTGAERPAFDPAHFTADSSPESAAHLGALLIVWVGRLQAQTKMSWSKAALARPLLPAYFSARRTGQLNPREDIAVLMQGKRPFPGHRSFQPAHPLCPDQSTLERYLAQLLHAARPQPYRAAALIESLPNWVDTLTELSLITTDEARRAHEELADMRPALARYWQDYPSDPTLLANLPG